MANCYKMRIDGDAIYFRCVAQRTYIFNLFNHLFLFFSYYFLMEKNHFRSQILKCAINQFWLKSYFLNLRFRNLYTFPREENSTPFSLIYLVTTYITRKLWWGHASMFRKFLRPFYNFHKVSETFRFHAT